MKRALIPIAVLVFSAWGTPSTSAQSITPQGSAVVGPGQMSGGAATLHLAGGGEILFKGLGPAFELGYLGPTEGLSEGLGVFCLNGVYHVPVGGRSRRLSPFVTGGYSLFFRGGSLNLWNVGGGVDVWFGARIGLRVDVRDHVRSTKYYSPFYGSSHTWHYWNVRTGIVFR